MDKNLAIIPARAGSKRIHKKNIKTFIDKPIIAYSIELAIKSGLFKEVMVSTDDYETGEIARKYGAEIPFYRSETNSDDHATLNDVFIETLTAYKNLGKTFDYVCMILPTAPLIRTSTLIKGLSDLKKEDFDSIRPIVKFSYPIQRAFRCSDGRIEMINPEFQTTRSQDLENAYYDAGQFYWINRGKSLLDRNKGGIEIPETEAQDIDGEEDWIMAEIKYKLMHKIL
jgi:N-acylneuraminate cytidylyltransferase